jgi:DNA processing protein
LQSGEARLVLESDPDFPRPLVGLPDIPPALLVWGALQERDRFAVGVVGTRQPSAYGRMVAERFTRDLCEAGLTIVSGGALGIDTVAHRTALEAGGRTVAILGSGLGSPYPAENRALFRRIAESGGAVVSQYAWDATPDQWRFPVRNRLIAAWGLGALVVEAPAQSGALITARLAAEYGREVFAVPGSIDNPKSKGCHALIKDGAALAESAEDILSALKIAAEPRERAESLPLLTEVQERLLGALDLGAAPCGRAGAAGGAGGACGAGGADDAGDAGAGATDARRGVRARALATTAHPPRLAAVHLRQPIKRIVAPRLLELDQRELERLRRRLLRDAQLLANLLQRPAVEVLLAHIALARGQVRPLQHGLNLHALQVGNRAPLRIDKVVQLRLQFAMATQLAFERIFARKRILSVALRRNPELRLLGLHDDASTL